MSSVDDFIDGFMIVATERFTGIQVQRVLKDYGLDVRLPISRGKTGNYWFQFANGPYSLEHNQALLE